MIAAVASAIAGAMLASAPVSAAPAGQQALARPHGAVVQVTTRGVHLSRAQVQTLRAAVADNRTITLEEVAKAAAPFAVPALDDPAGSGSSRGPCGVANLWGDAAGHFRMNVSFYVNVVGTASLGGVTVSTNGILAGTYGIALRGSQVSVGWQPGQAYAQLSTTGWGSTATTMSGWALTTGAWFCDIEVIAYWNF